MSGVRLSAISLLCALTACEVGGRSENPPPADTIATADTSLTADPGMHVDSLLPGFDPGTTQLGDTVLGLRVATRDVNRAFEDSVWVGTVRFDGELELRGVYQGHFDYPEVNAACFHVTDSASVRRVPRFGPDAHSTRMKTWFCFTNAERATQLLGSPAQPREATIVVDRYTAQRHFSDTWDSAELVRVVTLGAAAQRTLREPF